MSNLRNDAPTIDLSIPGTHDSAADSSTSFVFNLVPGPWKTQNLNIAEQLAIGVRFIDLRIKCNLG
jgi:1-phosphatidylinositol phosphodiesterase